jgi:hypothetical protein
MGRCPNCDVELRSTGEVAGALDVSGSCIRSALARHPDRLRGYRVGGQWLIPAEAAAQVRRRNGGIVLPPAPPAQRSGAGSVRDGDRLPASEPAPAAASAS